MVYGQVSTPCVAEDMSQPESSPAGRPRLFGPAATSIFRALIALVLLLVAGVGYAVWQYYHSPYWNRVGVYRLQPVLFSHRHHAGELHIDCRYCHATVETSAFAGMPSTDTCLTCHSQIFTHEPMLRPVIESAVRDEPLRWVRVNSLPDHVYFNHSIHIAKGIGCTTCHGQIGTMPLTAKGEPLSMRWCIDCHENPAPNLRPHAEVFAAVWTPPPNQASRGRAIFASENIEVRHLLNCSTCHH